MKLRTEVELEFSQQGCAIFAPSDGSRVTVEVHEGDSPETLNEVVLRGDKEGLRALAAAILATAESPIDGYHLHIDEDVNGPAYRSKQGFTLTIEIM